MSREQYVDRLRDLLRYGTMQIVVALCVPPVRLYPPGEFFGTRYVFSASVTRLMPTIQGKEVTDD